jgi:hypothetical protein
MANATLKDLEAKCDAAWANLTRQLQGTEPCLDRSDGPGQWTTRQVLSHLLGEPGRRPTEFLKQFRDHDLPVSEASPGQSTVTPERQKMSLKQFLEALDAQRREVLTYLESLPEADLERRKARLPFIKQFLGTDEISLARFVGLLYDGHWSDHAGQLGKIRKAVGL